MLKRIGQLGVLAAGLGLAGYATFRPPTAGYDREFFAAMEASARKSADALAPEILRLVKPQSVIDVGSGTGSWAAKFIELAVSRVDALDGPWLSPDTLRVPLDKFIVHDLRQPIRLDRTYDMVLCLETAEHLPPERADSFVADLTALAPMIWFSAAIPNQGGGTGHINEQWQAYWAEKFNAHGYVPLDPRPRIWNLSGLMPMYKQNSILYVRKDALEKRPDLQPLQVSEVMDLVHPDVFRVNLEELERHSRWKYKIRHVLD